MSGTNLDTVKHRRTQPQPKDGVGKLEAARQALAVVSELPDIVALIDDAEAIKAAAKAKRVSAEGINSWSRFVIDAERKAWARVKAMDGQLAKHRRPKGSELKTLSDLDKGLTKQRTHEWSMLARLTEDQLDEIERAANEADRVVTRRELLTLSKAGRPSPTKVSNEPPPHVRLAALRGARAIIAEIEAETTRKHKLQVDDDAEVNSEARGSWVQAWIFVEDELVRSDLADD